MKEKALGLLKKVAGKEAEFREDQWEAIESVLSGKKTLVVEKTGWGKSIVYFSNKIIKGKRKRYNYINKPITLINA